MLQDTKKLAVRRPKNVPPVGAWPTKEPWEMKKPIQLRVPLLERVMAITPEARNFIDDLFARTDGDTRGAAYKMILTGMAASILWAWREPTPSLVLIGNPEIGAVGEVPAEIMESYRALNDKNLVRTFYKFGDLPDGRRGVLPSFNVIPNHEMISIAISFGITGELFEHHFYCNKT